MQASANPKSARQGFTLVELLTVIVIITILLGLLTGAVVKTRAIVINSAMKRGESQMDMSLQSYKNLYGELPPSFVNVNNTNATLRTEARSAVLRHLRKAFPRLQLAGATVDERWTSFRSLVMVYQVWNPLADSGNGDFEALDPNEFDAASSLVFWLGGLPEEASTTGQWIPAGFHEDPSNPFRPGRPRKAPLFDFEHGRIAAVELHPDAPSDEARVRYLRYYPKWTEPAPYVYFRAQRVGASWQYGGLTDPADATTFVQFSYLHATGNRCVPYRDPQDPPGWRNYDTCQIIAAGRDGLFGIGGVGTLRESVTATNFTLDDYDNIANFSDGTLEDEIE